MNTVDSKHTPGPYRIVYSDVMTLVGYVKQNGSSIEMPICEIEQTGAEFSLAEERANAKFIEEACNNYYTLKDRVKVLEEQNEKLRYNLDKCKALLQGQTGFEFKESESKL
jgi:hypothetical protein